MLLRVSLAVSGVRVPTHIIAH